MGTYNPNGRIFKRHAKENEIERLQRAIQRCRDNKLDFAGLPYMENHTPEGLTLSLIVPENSSREHINQAFREAYRERDVVWHQVFVLKNKYWSIETSTEL